MLEPPSRQSAHSSLPIQFKNGNISTRTKASNEAVRQKDRVFSFAPFFTNMLWLLIGCNRKLAHLDEAPEWQALHVGMLWEHLLKLELLWKY